MENTLDPTNQEAPALPEDSADTLPSQEQLLDEAIALPETRTFLDVPLRKFSFHRYKAADIMGVKIVSANPDKRPQEENYPGLAFDASVIVWLCTIKDSEVYKVFRSPDWAFSKLQGWEVANKVEFGSPAQEEMIGCFGEIMSHWFNSISTPKTPGKQEEEQEEEPTTPPPPLV